MQSNQPRKLRARIPTDSSLSYVSPDESLMVISTKPSKLSLFKKSEFNEDPFNLNASSETGSQGASSGDYQLVKEVDLKVGTLILLQWVHFDSEPAFVVVSNNKALVVLDKDLQEIFRNEELLGSTDLCFFTCAAIKREQSGNLQGRFESVIRHCERVRFLSDLRGYGDWRCVLTGKWFAERTLAS